MRNYTKKTNRGSFSQDSLLTALEAIKNGLKVREASRKYGINHSTLLRYMKRQCNVIQKPGAPSIFSKAEEEKLVNHILECANMFHGLPLLQARNLAYQYAVELGKCIPKSWHDNKCAGGDWSLNFRSRHIQLASCAPTASNMTRSKSFNKENVRTFFYFYKKALHQYQFTASRIFNLDEAEITTIHQPGSILAGRCKKQAGMTYSEDRGPLVTICNVISADGQALPPVYVFPIVHLKSHMLNGVPAGASTNSLVLASPSGWMSTELFPRALQHFIKHMNVAPDNRALLLMDNHISHVSLQVKEMAQKQGLSILTFPPNCSHKMQPLDVSIYEPFRKFYNETSSNWTNLNVGRVLTIQETAELATYAFNKSLSIDNIARGFKATGIHPFNNDIFADVFAPSGTLMNQTGVNDENRAQILTSTSGSTNPQPSTSDNFG